MKEPWEVSMSDTKKRSLAATLLAVALLLLAGPYVGMTIGQVNNYPPTGGGLPGLTCTVSACTTTVPILLPGGSDGAPALALAAAPNTGINITQSGGDRITVSVAGTGRFTFDGARFRPTANDACELGFSTIAWTHGYFLRSIQGSKSKAITDNVATAFVRLSVSDDDYEGCGISYTAYAEDTATDARQTRTGRTSVAILNNSGAETAAFSAGDSAVSVTAGTLTCTFDGNSASADTIDLRATCDTSLAATTTLTFEYRLDCPSTVTVTPQ